MIFVTVGTTKFNSLIRAVDESGVEDEIIIQKGDGEYTPKNYEHFDYKPSVDQYYKKSDIVITHGGAGTLFRLLALGKKVIVVANLDRDDHHQLDLARKLSDEGYVYWCKKPSDIGKAIKKVESEEFIKYKAPKNDIINEIEKLI